MRHVAPMSPDLSEASQADGDVLVGLRWLRPPAGQHPEDALDWRFISTSTNWEAMLANMNPVQMDFGNCSSLCC